MLRGIGRKLREDLELKADVLWGEGTIQDMTADQYKMLADLHLVESANGPAPQPQPQPQKSTK